MKVNEIKNYLLRKFGEKLKSQIVDDEREVTTLLTDSRNYFNPEGTLFFAIRTEGGNDGHHFMKDLYNQGVRNFVAQYIPVDFPNNHEANILLVPDSVKSLTEIGKINRDNAKEIVAITGSRGKTTLKEMIFQLMEPYKNISRSPRSYNSKIGVPLSLWQITEGTDVAVIEAGISKKGEMQPLSDAIQPSTVIFTNIGEAHSQGFSSDLEKTEEKGKLAFGKNVKKVIYPLDSPLLHDVLKKLPKEKELIRWSEKDKTAELFIEEKPNGISFSWNNRDHFLPFKIEKGYDLENVAGALAFMLSEDMNPETILHRFSLFHRINTRLKVSEGINGCSVILDSYTSDLSSLQPAIDFMRRRKNPRQNMTLIISDLHYEGKNTDETYLEISKMIIGNNIERFIGIGDNIARYKNLFPTNSEFFKNIESFLKELSASDFNDEIILLKGSPEFEFEKIFEQLEAKKHETVLEVNLDAILRNYSYFRSQVPSSTGIICMVKAFGYGAGSYEIAKTLQDAGAAYLAVAVLDEGIDLRKNGITMPIMVMNPRSANYHALFRYRLEPVIYSHPMLNEFLAEIKKYGVGEYPVHIKLDTGMHRMGFESRDIDSLIEKLKETNYIKISSIFSHLATADCLDMDEYTFRQLERFEKMSQEIIDCLGYKVKRHILNSAGILRFPEFHYELVRLGIGLYGANTLPPEIERPLYPVSTLRSVIICLREIDGEEAVGYSRKGKINGKTKIATIPIGYADGMNRHFGNGKIKVLVNGKEVPTIGNICMDATMLDVTGIECKEGDSVEIFGEKMSVQALADTLDTIPYEILTSISPRVKRVYFRE